MKSIGLQSSRSWHASAACDGLCIIQTDDRLTCQIRVKPCFGPTSQIQTEDAPGQPARIQKVLHGNRHRP